MPPATRCISSRKCEECENNTSHGSWLRAGGMLLLVVAVYLLLKRAGLTGLSAEVEGVVGIGTVFTLGLLAATSSCLGTVGGLLLSVSAHWTENHPTAHPWERLKPLLLFNVGRLGGYFLFGGLVGLLGSAITLTSRITGVVTLGASLVMIMLGLNILRLVPKRFCRLPLPKGMQERIRALSRSQHPVSAFSLGALTFFLPCGFTQSVQLLALASGSFLLGGTIMFVFALGTLPSLLGISLLGSLSKGRFLRFFTHFAGATALFLGVMNLQSGLLVMGIDARTLLGSTLSSNTAAEAETDDPYVSIADDGRQIVTMYVSDAGYNPQHFTIEAGRETWIYAIAKTAVSGCANFLTAPTYDLRTLVKVGGNWLGPIRDPQKDFVLTCSMGMLKANIQVKG